MLCNVKRLQQSCGTWRVQDMCDFCSCSDLRWNSMSRLLCQWFCVCQPSKGWECLTFLGRACLGWEFSSSPDSVFFLEVNPLSSFSLGTDPISQCMLREWPPTMCFSALCPSVPTCSTPCLNCYCPWPAALRRVFAVSVCSSHYLLL